MVLSYCLRSFLFWNIIKIYLNGQEIVCSCSTLLRKSNWGNSVATENTWIKSTRYFVSISFLCKWDVELWFLLLSTQNHLEEISEERGQKGIFAAVFAVLGEQKNKKKKRRKRKKKERKREKKEKKKQREKQLHYQALAIISNVLLGEFISFLEINQIVIFFLTRGSITITFITVSLERQWGIWDT